MEFVVNEWLPEYFKPDQPIENKKQLEYFLNTFINRNDKIIVRRPSKFLDKIHTFKKNYQHNTKTYNQLGKFIKLILQDSERCTIVDDGEFLLSEGIKSRLVTGGNTISDLYLFEAASTTKNKLIITTDKKLHDLMNGEDKYNVELLDTFLEKY